MNKGEKQHSHYLIPCLEQTKQSTGLKMPPEYAKSNPSILQNMHDVQYTLHLLYEFEHLKYNLHLTNILFTCRATLQRNSEMSLYNTPCDLPCLVLIFEK